MTYRLRSQCRGCGRSAETLDRFLELGDQPLANAFPRDPSAFAAEARFPLDVCFCDTCKLVQTLDVVDPEVLFRDYIYVTGTSETIAAHNDAYARAVVTTLGLGPKDLVVEVASNDGSLLSRFAAHGVRTLGIEPARNIAEIARRAGVETIAEFFDGERGRAVRRDRGPAAVVIGNNVLAHVDDPVDFLSGAAALAGDEGWAIFEFPSLEELLDRLEYDTIYHEHLSYFSITAVANLFARAGLALRRVERVPVHGGSLRVWARKGAAPSAEVEAEMDREARAGLTDRARFRSFGALVEANRRDLLALLHGLKADGRSLAAYGAPAKGNTLLNYCGITADLIPYTVDRSPMKVGRFTPGAHIPVLAAGELLARRPDYTLILAWNFAAEIRRQQADYVRAGGRFILPLPEPRIVS
jgi:hypothetical protein